MSDKKHKISELKEHVRIFRDERDWRKYHTPKNLAESISIEAAELLEVFQWKDEGDKEKVREELADILIYCLSLSNILNIDLSEAIFRKIQINRAKYPIKESKGNHKKYSESKD